MSSSRPFAIALFIALLSTGCLLPPGGNDTDEGDVGTTGPFGIDSGRDDSDTRAGPEARDDRPSESLFRRRLAATQSLLRKGVRRADENNATPRSSGPIEDVTIYTGESGALEFSGRLDVERLGRDRLKRRYTFDVTFENCRQSGVRIEGRVDYTATFLEERQSGSWTKVGLGFETRGELVYAGTRRDTCRYDLTIRTQGGDSEFSGSACGYTGSEIRDLLMPRSR